MEHSAQIEEGATNLMVASGQTQYSVNNIIAGQREICQVSRCRRNVSLKCGSSGVEDNLAIRPSQEIYCCYARDSSAFALFAIYTGSTGYLWINETVERAGLSGRVPLR